MPDVEKKAPDFNLLDQNRNRIVLSKALKKGKVLLVFYPHDDTPVCTAQLCDYRDHYTEFQKLGVQVFGITINHPEDHTAFAEKHHFPFPLLNDYDGRVTRAYGVMGILGMPKRALFLIGEDQRILYKHVEVLPIFRRSSQELIPALAEKLGVPPPAVSASSHSSHASPSGH